LRGATSAAEFALRLFSRMLAYAVAVVFAGSGLSTE
jgi:hypothetical protein